MSMLETMRERASRSGPRFSAPVPPSSSASCLACTLTPGRAVRRPGHGAGKTMQILNSDDHANYLRKQNRNPADYRPEIIYQIGLDGIRMLDPSTSRTLRIYPLDTLMKWEVLDSTVFVICAKTSVYFEAKLIRLKSNSYSSNTLLDTVIAATVQNDCIRACTSLIVGTIVEGMSGHKPTLL